MASPLPLQHANTVCYVGEFSSPPGPILSNLKSEEIKDQFESLLYIGLTHEKSGKLIDI
jgi:hypothetical protein